MLHYFSQISPGPCPLRLPLPKYFSNRLQKPNGFSPNCLYVHKPTDASGLDMHHAVHLSVPHVKPKNIDRMLRQVHHMLLLL